MSCHLVVQCNGFFKFKIRDSHSLKRVSIYCFSSGASLNLFRVSMVVMSGMDLIRTIEDDEEVENLSETSDVEIEVRFTLK